MCEHIRSSWIPGARILLEAIQIDVAEQLKALGGNADDDKAESARAEFSNLASLVIKDCENAIDTVLKEGEDDLMSPSCIASVHYPATIMLLRDEEEAWPTATSVIESLKTAEILNELGDLVTEQIAVHFGQVEPSSCLDRVRGLGEVWAKWLRGEPTPLLEAAEDMQHLRNVVQAFNWGRFPILKEALHEAVLKYMSQKYCNEAVPSIEKFVGHFVESCSPATALTDHLPWLVYNCKAIIVRKVLVPLLKVEAFFKLRGIVAGVKGGLGHLMKEDAEYKTRRIDLVERLDRIQESLRMLDVVSGRMDDHGDMTSGLIK
jgi:hypothetical protein